MMVFVIFIGGLMLIAIVSAVILERAEYRSVHYVPTEEELAKERGIMELEKLHFGRYSNYYQRQTKEYQAWLKPVTNKS